MKQKITPEIDRIMKDRFGKDSLIALATVSEGRPCVRTVNSYYENGSFYIVTYALSDKMKQIEICPDAAICGDWFTAKGTGENLGHVLSEDNLPLIQRLREVFAEWYSGGHVDESDPNTCILRIRLTEGVLFSNGTRYEIDFT